MPVNLDDIKSRVLVQQSGPTPQMVLVYESDFDALIAELKHVTEKHDRLHERLLGIERANVDSWKNGYATAQRQIAAWLQARGPINHLWAAEVIERGYYREEEG